MEGWRRTHLDCNDEHFIRHEQGKNLINENAKQGLIDYFFTLCNNIHNWFLNARKDDILIQGKLYRIREDTWFMDTWNFCFPVESALRSRYFHWVSSQHYHRILLKFSHSLSFTIVYKTAVAVVYILSLSLIRIQFLFCLSLDKCLPTQGWSHIDYRSIKQVKRVAKPLLLCKFWFCIGLQNWQRSPWG